MTIIEQTVAPVAKKSQASEKKILQPVAESKTQAVVKPVVEGAPRLQPIADDATGRKSFKVLQAKVALVEYTFTPNEDKLRYQTSTTLDFTGCSDEEILELASKSIIIRLQNERRALPLREACNPVLHVNVDVKDEISGGRKTADPATQARSAIGKMDIEEARKLLKELEKNLK